MTKTYSDIDAVTRLLEEVKFNKVDNQEPRTLSEGLQGHSVTWCYVIVKTRADLSGLQQRKQRHKSCFHRLIFKCNFILLS